LIAVNGSHLGVLAHRQLDALE
ncbi:hypothetical protein A2U01_0116002, partial [Trifolium medium]|nr:hypothetical protein [Trifolium medium]